MRFEGLLTGQQKCDGYFTMMDDDFVWLFWHEKNTDKPRLIKCWLLDLVTIKEVRDAADADNELH